LVTRRVKPEKVYREIGRGLLVLFIGLFVLAARIEKTTVEVDLFAAASAITWNRREHGSSSMNAKTRRFHSGPVFRCAARNYARKTGTTYCEGRPEW
jgi:hypothetical protein